MKIVQFTFNSFQENTYLIFDSQNIGIIIDPGCSTPPEMSMLDDFIKNHTIDIKAIVNTHCHIDHVLGIDHVSKKYGVDLFIHDYEQVVLDACPRVADMYGMTYQKHNCPVHYIDAGATMHFGQLEFKSLFCPGHSPGSLAFYFEKEKIVIAGDVLFDGSIGRTDLPGGDYNTLIHSIQSELFTLPDDVQVYPGHGGSTTIGKEKRSNPFFQ